MTQLLFSFVYNLPAIMLALSLFFIFVFIAFRRKRTINDYQQIRVFNSIFKKYLIINLIFSLIILKLNIDDIFDMPAVYILGFIFFVAGISMLKYRKDTDEVQAKSQNS